MFSFPPVVGKSGQTSQCLIQVKQTNAEYRQFLWEEEAHKTVEVLKRVVCEFTAWSQVAGEETQLKIYTTLTFYLC